ncbi:Ppx/GppA phosphatase family protein [Rhodoligotrophos defluvii]|uniref:Ppx/GppA phosphatase family protein n=1 Tax=Rhodoligotrophos defluvii TaxID=2561934 RepID=UPI001EF149C6|nr:Ppx/GppA phosphatase family protein [Rhodoligotrophos defluvii]
MGSAQQNIALETSGETGQGLVVRPRQAGQLVFKAPGVAACAAGQRNGRVPVYGALDLGTNNCRLLIARPAASGFKVIDAFSRIVRLGEGVTGSGRLSDQAMSRTIEALRVCASKLAWQKVTRCRLIATEACRTAVNGASFIERVARETGLRLEIIDRSLEAELAVAGSAALLAPDARTALVFDIGGGSTELMWLELDHGRYRIANWTSLPFGVVTLAETFGGIDVTPAQFDAMLDFVAQPLHRFAEACGAGAGTPPDHLLGTSGTVTTIAGVHLALMRYDRSKVDGCWLHRDDVRRVTRQLLAMSYSERAASPCIGRDRADLVLAGCAILEGIQALWPSELIRVADRGLREGILTTLMVEDGTFGCEPGLVPGALAEASAV